MNTALNLKPDRQTIARFLGFYSKKIAVDFPHVVFPEDDSATPTDARIDAIYFGDKKEMHVEHTSVDLIVSGKTNKRSLDLGFLILEAELKKIICPAGQGVNVLLPLRYAKDIPKLKRIAAGLADKVTSYITSTAASEWNVYPRTSDLLEVEGWQFQIRPDVLHKSEVKLTWAGSDENFLTPAQIEKTLQGQLPSKISKLDRSLVLSKAPSFAVLIVETNDIAARGFHACCGMFARTITPLNSRVSEIWGLHGNSEPTLVWCDALDKDRHSCVYSEDPAYRSYAEIQDERMNRWIMQRQAWFRKST